MMTLAWVLLLPAYAGPPQPFGVPTAWIDAMRRAEVMSADRQTIHVSHTCDLQVEGAPFHVVDVREVLAFMPAPRGINHIVVLNGGGNVVQALSYADERPLRCDGNRLLLWSELSVGATGSAGNVLVFTDKATTVAATTVALADFAWGER